MTMDDTIERLAEASKQLNEQSDKVSEAIEEIDDELRNFNFGLPVWPVEILGIDHRKPFYLMEGTEREGDEDEIKYDVWADLGYDKVDGDWCLAVRHTRELADQDQGYGRTPPELIYMRALADSSRQEKLKALDAIPALLKCIVGEVEGALKKMEEFNGKRAEILKAFKQDK